jgi:deazaflavin-dependent oxidoreductase (nitroreductase family)
MKDYVDETVANIDRGELPQWISDHVRTYRESGGMQGHYWDATAVGGSGPVPCLLLTTVGRRSGKATTHPLVYGMDGDRYVIVGSKGGADTHPQWYFNLRAAPTVDVQAGPERFTATATLASGDERLRLWSLMTRVYPPYEDYQAKTQREIPIFVLQRQAED